MADEGPGLDAENAARVFERFYRADPSRARDRGGTGLGLAVVAALVEAHGGRVEVDATPGAGATFRVRLPVAPGQRGGACSTVRPTSWPWESSRLLPSGSVMNAQ